MFIEKLTYEQKNQIREKIRKEIGDSCYRMSVENMIVYGEEAVEFFVYDNEIGNYRIIVTDTHLFSTHYKMGNTNEIKLHAVICKEMRNFFGEEYKDYFMKQREAIFE